MSWVTAVARVRSLALELLQATGLVKKKSTAGKDLDMSKLRIILTMAMQFNLDKKTCNMLLIITTIYYAKHFT